VIRKAEDPVWTKPDWAFVEEGKAVPDKWSERRDYDTLGDYALYLGDGYMIHGTLYQRYLGRAITHGCIRLGDEDLERVYRSAPVGTPVLIF
jgi:L,D-transpeptidase YbiS